MKERASIERTKGGGRSRRISTQEAEICPCSGKRKVLEGEGLTNFTPFVASLAARFKMTKKFGCGKAGFHNRKETMAARRFINETLLPSLEREFAEEAKGNKHSLVRFEDAMRGMTRFIESHRDHWDANEIG